MMRRIHGTKEIKEICDEYIYDTEYEDPYMIE